MKILFFFKLIASISMKPNDYINLKTILIKVSSLIWTQYTYIKKISQTI